MKFYTEAELRDHYRSSPFETLYLPLNSRLTQAAEQFLSERRVKVVRGDSPPAGGGEKVTAPERPSQAEGYILPDGRSCREKPEHMTHLRGRSLVDKNHPVIRLRGRLDSLQGLIIDTVNHARGMGLDQMALHLEEILALARGVMRAEVTGEEMADPGFDGLDSAAVRDMSHHPHKYLGVKHFLPSPSHGLMMSRLNLVRTSVREAELAAAGAFYRDDGRTERIDIMTAMNRMSSMVYIIMCRLLAGKYQIGAAGGQAAGR